VPKPVSLSDIELSLQEVLLGAQGSDNDLEIAVGASAGQLQEMLAWKSMYNNILWLRESYVQMLLAGDNNAAQNRKAIVVMDSILKMPAALGEIGKRAKGS